MNPAAITTDSFSSSAAPHYAFILSNHSVRIPISSGHAYLLPVLGPTVEEQDLVAMDELQALGLIRSYRYIACKTQPVFLAEA